MKRQDDEIFFVLSSQNTPGRQNIRDRAVARVREVLDSMHFRLVRVEAEIYPVRWDSRLPKTLAKAHMVLVLLVVVLRPTGMDIDLVIVLGWVVHFRSP